MTPPVKKLTDPDDPAVPTDVGNAWGGLTKRELFTAIAMLGTLMHHEMGLEDTGAIADEAVDQADAVIARLNRRDED